MIVAQLVQSMLNTRIYRIVIAGIALIHIFLARGRKRTESRALRIHFLFDSASSRMSQSERFAAWNVPAECSILVKEGWARGRARRISTRRSSVDFLPVEKSRSAPLK